MVGFMTAITMKMQRYRIARAINTAGNGYASDSQLGIGALKFQTSMWNP